MRTLICNCNRTMPLDAPSLGQALAKTPGATPEGLDVVHTLLCRREAAAFQRAAKSGDELVVACTQEQRLFLELNAETEGARSVDERPIRFVNIRETGGWSKDAASATPKIAALIAAAQLPAPLPVPTVSYRSSGHCLVVGAADAGARAAALLGDALDVIQLVDRPGGTLSQMRERAVHAGRLTRLSGWLGAFSAEWTSDNPIDLELCTRCNACVEACPEQAIDLSYQVDLARCQSHRACVRVCDAAGAIDFGRAPLRVEESVDAVLDLRAEPAFAMHQPPQGYFHVGADEARLQDAVRQLRGLVGEFEKPKFFQYKAKLCAHSRNQQIGCRSCIDVCSAQAIRSDASLKGKARVGGVGGALTAGIVVEPHLCVGCGACSTVCPTGALAYGYPSPVDQGQRLRTMLAAYASAGGRDAALLIHSEGQGQAAIDALGRAARTSRDVQGVPARVLPVAVWHTASIGLDLWLSAIAFGARQVWVLLTDEEAPDYRRALAEQMAVGQAILSGLGFAGEHFRLVESASGLDGVLRAVPAQGVGKAATFAVSTEKRVTLEMAVDHLVAQAPARADDIALPAAGSPFGSLVVDNARCTLCLSCVGACPASALADNPDQPQLKFIEKNCVQCGLCVSTCPEDAITLQPRLWLADDGKARKAARVLAEMAPWRCVRCAKPFGTQRAIENMVARLAGHSAFQGAAAERLKMCADCRVIDLHSDPGELKITDI